jgi:NADPH-dependent F420 reductase
MRIAIVGGTGNEGRGLAVRWSRAGHAVVIGSRNAERAQEVAAKLNDGLDAKIEAAGNVEAVRDAEVALLAVPYSAHAPTLRELREPLRDKILIDITVPLKPPKVAQVSLPEGRAAALEARALLDPSTAIAATLHHVSALHLADPQHAIDCDVLVCADDANAMKVTLALIADLGMRAFDAGPLQNAVALESLTPVLIHLNKRYKSGEAGLRFTGIKSGVMAGTRSK